VRWLAATLALGLGLGLGCWRTAPAPPRAPASEQLCVGFAFKGLSIAPISVGDDPPTAFEIANTDALADAEQAEGRSRTDMHGAAGLFVRCAQRYRSVPDADPQRARADVNATSCYENAMYAYAMAGELAAEGKPALERAATEDRRLTAELHRMLASPPDDCEVRP